MAQKILILPRYSELGASSRYRFYEYIEHLKEDGFECTISPLFSDKYLVKTYSRSYRVFEVIRCYLKRIIILFNIRKYDSCLVEKELLPFFPYFIEFVFFSLCNKYVIDYDDAIFHRYDDHKSPIIRYLFSNKIGKLMKNAECVLVGNEYLYDYAKFNLCNNIKIIPTVVDIEKYDKVATEKNEQFTIVWIGSQATVQYLLEVIEPITRVCNKVNGKLLVVGAIIDVPNIQLELVEWSQDSEVEYLKSAHVGIMPLSDNKWNLGKCGFKIIQYMACGIPVVASPIGVNTKIISDRRTGFLAHTADEWFNCLYLIFKGIDKSITTAAYQNIVNNYSMSYAVPLFIKTIRNSLSNNIEKYVIDTSMEKYASVTVVIPCYNCTNTIDRAIKSVANQTLIPKEVVLVDDCSEDGTLEKIYELQEQYTKDWIRIVKLKEKLGPGGARNAGWDASTQDFIAFLDADDSWLPFKVATQYSWMKNNPHATMIGHYWSMCDDIDYEYINRINTTKVGHFSQLFQNNFTTSSVMCVRNIKLRFEERKYASEDFLLWCLIIFEGYDVYKSDKPLSCIHKLPYGEGGLSGNLLAMEIGALKSYKSLFIARHISFFSFLFFSLFEILKFLRRVVSRSIVMKLLK